MLTFVSGDLFDTDAEALVNTVNCVGAMGRGVAEGVRKRWPRAYEDYRRDCGIGLSCDGGRDPSVGPMRHQRAAPCCGADAGRDGPACPVHRVRPGHVAVRPTGGLLGVRLLFDLPTKRHWYSASRIGDVEAGLRALADAVEASGVRSVAMPPPGCGHGGLSWRDVGPLVAAALGPLDGVDIRIYAPPVPLPGVPPRRAA